MQISTFEPSDIPFLPSLQPADWGDLTPRFQYFIQSDFCNPLKIMLDGQMVAIGTSMLHGDTAWLACIITHADHRNKGLGKAITSALIERIDSQRYPTIYLDATVYGFPVYQKLGFVLEAEYTHLKSANVPEKNALPEHIFPFKTEHRDSIYLLDQQAYGEERKGILADFVRLSYVYLKDGEVQGYYIPGWGDFPVVASNATAGHALLAFRAEHIDRAIMPSVNSDALDYLQGLGYEMYKISRRMRLGPAREWQPKMIFNRVSGQLG